MKPACTGQPMNVFFEDGWKDTPYSLALANARDFCDCCPMRRACLKMEVDLEKGESLDYRAGIYGGFTPQQRHTLHKRGVSLNCPDCGDAYDPVELRDGTLRCSCGVRVMSPIPDRGDQWTERHTKLARMTIGWLTDNVEVGGEVPDALALSRTMKVGVKDLRRVYQALIEDHVLLKSKGGIRRRQTAASAKHWTPVHLRPGTRP